MSDDALDVDPDGLDKSGRNMGDVADKIKLIRDEYLDKLTSYHGCWGDGEFGEAFAKKYVPAEKDLEAGVTGLADGLSGSGRSQQDAGKKFRGLSDDIGTHLRHGR
ncbi:hypothetical protein RGF97_01590 [Streptomyces roseicoloratus]|uniref:WXG100 family type VII secretion target n=1 Tax=Streptomyces roseicoloratus TaxID=2508722 RepID=A0ABY9RNP6_9ACTN|nr:hypothetical protein [Streptomyces roseicoloratus]WMX43818.1 hypothetical protein RGF97_01590 [Streptomyces roseicoloratus]